MQKIDPGIVSFQLRSPARSPRKPIAVHRTAKRFRLPLLLCLALLVLALPGPGLGLGPSAVQAQPFAYVPNAGSDDVSVIDTATNTVTSTIAVGAYPYGVAVTPDGSTVYVSNHLSNNVSVIDAASNTVTATIGVGSGPYGAAATPNGAAVYVANAASDTVSVIDTLTNTVTATIAVGDGPVGVAVTPDGTAVYVVNVDDGSVSVIDTATNAVKATIALGGSPFSGLVVTPDSAAVYVVNAGLNNVSVIDTATNTVTATIAVGGSPFGAAVTPDGSTVYVVSNQGDGTVSVIDTATNTVRATFTVGGASYLYGVAVTPDGAALYVSNFNYNRVLVIDTATNTITNTIGVGTDPIAFGQFIRQPVLTPVHPPFAYVANSGTNNVSVIDTASNTLKAIIAVGDDPFTAAVTPDGAAVYVVNRASGNISVIDAATNTVTATIAVGSDPFGLAVTPDGTAVYVAWGGYPGLVSVIDTATNTVTTTFAVGNNPYSVAVAPDGATVYVANGASANISVIDAATNTVTATIAVGSDPFGLAVMPDGSTVYVTNASSSNVSVIDTGTNTVTATIAVGSVPYNAAVTPDGAIVYVTNAESHNVSAIDTATNTVTATIAVGRYPSGVAVTPDGSSVYVANYSDHTVSVIDRATQTVTATLAVGARPASFGRFIGPTVEACTLAVDKKCQVVPPDPGPFECNSKLDTLKMIWNGPGTLQNVYALPGGNKSFPRVDISAKDGLQVVTVSGYQPSGNDVVWQWVSDIATGQSRFYLGCTDAEMDGAEDCGSPQGNGKKNDPGYDNVWLLDGLAGDNGYELDCTPDTPGPADQCAFDAPPPPGCRDLGQPLELTFRYTGADCTAGDNGQGAGAVCIGTPGADPVDITVITDPAIIQVSPDSGIKAGDLVTVSALDQDMGGAIQLLVGGQFLEINTDCTAPLTVNDVFGSLELTAFNGQGTGALVTYVYEVKNTGDTSADVTSVFDNQLGELLETAPVSIAPGGSLLLDKTAYISQTTTNVVSASGQSADGACNDAVDEVTVSVTEPACAVAGALYRLEDSKVKWTLTNTGRVAATLEALTVSFPASYGLIQEIRLDGSIFKKAYSSAYPDGVPPGATITLNDWTGPEASRRRIEPGQSLTLDVVFTEKSGGAGWAGLADSGTAVFSQGCDVVLAKPSGCDIGKPAALVFEYTGQGCVDGNDQGDASWGCSGDPAGVEPVRVVMAADADKFTVVQPDAGIGLNTDFEIIRNDGRDFARIMFDIRHSGVTLQSLQIDTSCSQPLRAGDQFGSVILRQVEPKP